MWIVTQLEQEEHRSSNVLENYLGLYLIQRFLATFLPQSCMLLWAQVSLNVVLLSFSLYILTSIFFCF